MALFNIGTLTVTMLFLLGIYWVALAKTKNFMQSWRFFSADCGRTTVTNTMLHLLINIFSTLVLASSNFFMQVLNAPTRSEADTAHAQVPIHMMFNSSVFKIDKRMGDFHVTVASNAFIEGGSYFLPGASMIISNTTTNGNLGDTALLPTFQDLVINNVSQYALNVSQAAAIGSEWEKLEPADCGGLFNISTCTGLTNFRNLVIVLKGSGWKRSETWNLSANNDEMWQPILPRDEFNTLWYSAQCAMSGTLTGDGFASCLTNCEKFFKWKKWEEDESRVSILVQDWYRSQPVPDYHGFELDHCRAEPRNTTCSVALAKPLLLIVLISIFMKILTCMVVIKWNNAENAIVMAPIGGANIHFLTTLVANIPQLYLSSNYYVINSLITQMEMEWELSEFSTKHRPLRVTKPKGQQTSTYRLQLPYKLSVPLMVSSVLMHWLLSNALFMVVSQGTYYVLGPSDYIVDPDSLPRDAAINLGSSRAHTLALFLVGILMMICPTILSRQKLPGQMPVVGSNSMAIAAACRVSPLAQVPPDSHEENNMQETELAELTGEYVEAANGSDNQKKMIYYPLKWGEVKMPKDWSKHPTDGQEPEEVGHLSFGTVLDCPSPPKDGRLYV
ncbi:hypothetical protein CGCS363_v004720 [Colletotrichum siamense]|uniref:uncharacterized protein n=1 Tax=Colletotrichum siamense TaxID=690259 RepID=UPI0018730818|nr:uncharacterized protein CGCS363_v004720 [Colletotrichum siamense]KAF5506131.1 hypothetical protein CGCS363_v004720 [Colletotrichum siamense]